MKKTPEWLIVDFVLSAHEFALASEGGLSGVRDHGLLESALDRPKNLFNYEGADIIELAVCYADAIIRNHPFVDGNKRTAFISMYAFLKENRHQFRGAEAEVVVMFEGFANKTVKKTEFTLWVRENTIKNN
ncbi:MAG: type II toxin-antitoxin system death-on-curing family toxin [Planctomycetota bacterium]